MPVIPQSAGTSIVPAPLDREAVVDAFDSLDGAVYLIDGALRLIHFNDGWRRLPSLHAWFQLSGPPEPGQDVLEYVKDPLRRAELSSLLRHVLAEGTAQDMHATTDCGRVWRMSLLPWRRGGRIRGVICRVTEDSWLSEAQGQLQQLQRMETLGALTAGTAHDFNNLLLAIRGNVGLLLLDDKTSAAVRSRLDQVETAAARASDLSQRLLSLGRPAEEKIAVIDLNRSMQEAAEMATRALRSKVKLTVTPSSEPAWVHLDPAIAVQVLLNFCLNAGDAMLPQARGGEIRLTSEFVSLDAARAVRAGRTVGQRFICCSVVDTGSGIAPEILPRIFTPFFTTKPRGKGTGLGLAVAHRVVQRAGGFIEVDSTPGAGATFRILLPLDPPPVEPAETDSPRSITKGAGRVLVVDDLDLVRDFTVQFLQRAGYEVVAADGAAAALEILEREGATMDAVLSDYSMPGENGWQLVSTILQRWPRIRCVLASGYLDEMELAEIEADPRVRLLHKPYSIADATAVLAGKTNIASP
ncbi:MAG: two-component system, cell cycle sensor histidine kinase and response regulator CckA [Verrucomicrobiota bacterium]|jgi:signal transduction histidine kinase